MSVFCSSTFAQAEVSDAEKQAVQALRKWSTNLQFNKDGTARLIRFSKPLVTDDKLAPLRELTSLDYVAIVSPEVTDTGIAHVAGLKRLDTLVLSGTQLDDVGLEALRNLTGLERLFLANTQITDAGLKQLAHLQSLKILSLEHTRVGDAGMKQISALANLEVLLLGDTHVGDASLKGIAALPKLRVLVLTRCPVSEKGLSQLADCKKLEQLVLNGCQLSNDAESVLKSLTHVKHIEMYKTGIAPSTVARLREQGVRIHPARGESAAAPIASSPEANKPPDSSRANLSVLRPVSDLLNEVAIQPDFQRHVVPLLGRLGCNGRACHGSFQGQGGFRLSMFGYDFKMDHKNLAARIDLETPGESLVLNKPTSADEHEGGQRLPPGGWEQELLRRWIEDGALGVTKDAPQFVRLDVSPTELVFHKKDEQAQLRVVAVWSDGTREDVTCLTRFETKDDSIAYVGPTGIVTSKGRGDTHVVAYYDNGVVATPAMLAVSEHVDDHFPKMPTPTRVDELVVTKLKKLGIVPSEISGDAEFLRRVSLDLVGTLPTPAEIDAFLADDSADKRQRKIDELLERPAYVTWWTTRLCDLTGSNAGYLGSTEMAQPVAAQWRAWIERRVQDNAGWNEIVRGIVLATSRAPGQSYQEFIAEQSEFTRRKNPKDFAAPGRSMPHFWFRSNLAQPKDKALAFGYTFLGTRLDCAECHKHPFDQWSKQDFEQFTAFFTRIRAGVSPEAKSLHDTMQAMLGVPVKLNTAALRRQSYLRIAAEGRPIPWREVYIEPAGKKPQTGKLLGGKSFDLTKHEDPRQLLMDWLENEPNRYLAKAFVNRVWANYFNVGIIEPPDDINLANPPSNRELLDYLVEEFVRSNYDMKWLHRTITNSRTYQLCWKPNATNRNDKRHFSHAIPRRLPAEVAIDAILQATVNDAALAKAHERTDGRKIGQHPKSFQTRSIDYSLLIFGKPLRTTNCDCERRREPTLLQSLYVRNDTEMLQQIVRKDSWIAQVKNQTDGRQLNDLIRQAYLRTLSRPPRQTEIDNARKYLSAPDSDFPERLEDIVWALLNTQEFITNH